MERRKPPSPERSVLSYLNNLLVSTTEMTKEFTPNMSDQQRIEHVTHWRREERQAKAAAARIVLLTRQSPAARQTLHDEINRIRSDPDLPFNPLSLAKSMIQKAEIAADEFARQIIAKRNRLT